MFGHPASGSVRRMPELIGIIRIGTTIRTAGTITKATGTIRTTTITTIGTTIVTSSQD